MWDQLVRNRQTAGSCRIPLRRFVAGVRRDARLMVWRDISLHCLHILVLGSYMVLSPLGVAIATAEESPPTAAAPPAVTSPPAATTLPAATAAPASPPQPAEPAPAGASTPSAPSAIEKEMDTTHARLEEGILEQVIRFDNFFGTVKSDSHRQTAYELHWRNSVRVEQGGNLRFGTSVRATAVLSKISQRLRLAISGESEPEPFASRLPEDPGNPGFDRPFETTRVVNTELRYELFQTPSMEMFLGAGVRLVLPPEVFVRSRFQYTHHFDSLTLIRIAETFFSKDNNYLGETTEVTLERSLNPKTLFRWAYTGTVSYEASGLEWGTELSVIHELSSRSAITVTGGVYGNSTVGGDLTNYRIATRYRRNFLRKWLFYEVEPEVSWPRSQDGNFPVKFACTFLLEIAFQGSAVGKEK